MSSTRYHLRKDDKVKVLVGKDKGKIGRVLKITTKTGRVLVENVNIVKRHTRPSAQNRQGGIIESEAPLHISNVMLMCNKCMAPGRVQMQRLEDGKKKRICRQCGEMIDA